MKSTNHGPEKNSYQVTEQRTQTPEPETTMLSGTAEHVSEPCKQTSDNEPGARLEFNSQL